MIFSLPNRRESPVAYKLLLLIIISSSLVTFIITAIQLYFDYKTDISLIEKRILQIENSYLDSIAISVWNFNKKQYEIQLDGILNIEDIIYVEIIDSNARSIVAKGSVTNKQIIERIFSLHTIDFGKDIYTGKLIVVASLTRVYQDLIKKGLLILFTQAIKTILISAVIIFSFYYLVTRHLWKISEYVHNQDINSDNRLVLDKPESNHPDELDKVVNAFNDMKEKFLRNCHQIEKFNQELEQKVNDRTQTLNETCQQLENQHLELKEAQKQLLKHKEELEILATVDPLTQIYNRRKFQQILEYQWRHTRRRKVGFAVLMIDIDYFKNYNDNYGHSLGDKALFSVAQTIKEALLRPLDSVSRYGGEEFIVLLPDIDFHGARHVAQNIQKAIKSLSIPHDFSFTDKHITLSIGGVIGNPNNSGISSDYLKQADKLLYKAKSEGRNKVILEVLSK
jgi:diguanylate cyclase (GGDEF)-like protein